MNFLNSLKNGQSGIKINIPDDFVIQSENDWGVNLIDQEHQVYWHFNLSSGMLDLHPDHHDLMLKDIETYARTEFEFEFNQYCQENSIDSQPRTADNTWSPVIEVKIVSIETSKALYVLRRLAYQPCHEIVVGHLLIPTTEGTYELNAYSTTNSTGYRESLLFQQSLSSRPEFLADETSFETSLEEFTNNFRQQDMDDPQHDQLFPEHPLSCIRAAMLWLLDNNGGNIQITKPLPPIEKEVKLLNLGCAIIPPPRYVYNRAMAKLLNPMLAQFSRFALPDTGSGFSLGTFTIYKVPDVKITGNNCQQKLIQLATKMLQDWEKEGVTNINIETQDLSSEKGRNQISTHTTFQVNNRHLSVLAYWFVDTDGAVFRIEFDITSSLLTKEESFAQLDIISNGWRRLESDVTQSSNNQKNNKKQWWKFW